MFCAENNCDNVINNVVNLFLLQRHVLKYEKLLKNTKRPEILIKEIKVSVIAYL